MNRTQIYVLCLFLFAIVATPQTDWTYTVDTAAGHYPMGDGGPATNALLGYPESARPDAQGNVYIADTENLRIRKVDTNGNISTLATLPNRPRDLLVLPNGSLVAGCDNGIYQVDAAGTVTMVVGRGGFGAGGDGGPALDAQIGGVGGMTIGPGGSIYFTDRLVQRVRRFMIGGTIETVAGSGTSGFFGDGGPALEAQMSNPRGVALDIQGNLYVSDEWNNRVRKVDAAGNITTIAGDGGPGCPQPGAKATETPLGRPVGVIWAPNGNLYVTSAGCSALVQITPAGVVALIAGSFGFAGDGGIALNARFNSPQHMHVSPDGQLYIADRDNLRIRHAGADLTINTIAGKSQFAGDGGPAKQALLLKPEDVGVDTNGNLLIADSNNQRIRRVDAGGTIQTIGGNGEFGFDGDGGPATAAALNTPTTLGTDPVGNIYLANTSRVRRISPTGTITTVAGNGGFGNSGDGGPAKDAQFGWVRGLAGDAAGNFYLSDNSGNRVRRVGNTGMIAAFAGTGDSGGGGDGGPAVNAQLAASERIALGPDGSLYIADRDNQRIRRVNSAGVISTVAGNGERGNPEDGEQATSQPLPRIDGVAVDADGNIYVSDSMSVWKVSTEGVIRRIAGGRTGFSGEGELALGAAFANIGGLAAGPNGVIYVADRDNHRIRRLTPFTPSNAAAAGGTTQNGIAGQPLGEGFRVKVTGAGNIPLAGVTVSYSVGSGSLTLSSGTAVTDENGIAVVGGTLGGGSADVTVTATVGGLGPVNFTVNVVEDPQGLGVMPGIDDDSVVGAGLSRPLVRAVSTRGIVSIFGRGYAPAGSFRQVGERDMVNGKLPTNLDGICATFNGLPGYPLHVLENQLNVQTPVVEPGTTVEVQVLRNCGTPQELPSVVRTVPALERTPEFFYWTHPETGPKPIAAVNPVTGAFIGEPGLRPGMTTVPAETGDIIDMYTTGYGPVASGLAPGEIPTQISPANRCPTVTIGGEQVASEDVLYCGNTQWAGVDLLRIKYNLNLPDGPQPVTIAFSPKLSIEAMIYVLFSSLTP